MSALAILSRQLREHPAAPRERRCGVYLLFSAGQCIYVGSSTDIEIRLEHHRVGIGGAVAKSFDRVLWLPLPFAVHTYYEGALIRALKPALNCSSPADRGHDAEILAGLGLPVPESALLGGTTPLSRTAPRTTPWNRNQRKRRRQRAQ